MKPDSTISDVAFVIASCDKYSDLWPPLFGELFRHWPDCPFQIFLISNYKTYAHPQVTTLTVGEDLDWSTTVHQAIQTLDHKYILFWIDDAFLSASVDMKSLHRALKFAKENDANFVRLRPNPLPRRWVNEHVGILGQGSAYRVSLFATLWKSETLNKILQPGESAWQFELKGSERSRSLDGFYALRNDVFRYLHGVERGVWIRPTARRMQKQGYIIDGQARPIMSRVDNLRLKYRLFKSWVLHLLPESRREDALRYARRAYQWMGIR